MARLIITNKTKIMLIMLFLFLPLSFFCYKVWSNLQFLVQPSEITNGTIVDVSQRSFFTHVTYVYSINNQLYEGNARKDFIPIFSFKSLTSIRYLQDRKDVSTIDCFIFSNLFVDLFELLIFLFVLLLFVFGFLHKLPSKNQKAFDTFLTKRD